MKLRKRGLREDRRRFLVEGPQAVGEALKASGLEILFHIPEAGLHPHVSAARERGVDVVEVDEGVVRALTSAVTPQGLVGVAPFLDAALDQLPDFLSLVVVLCAIRDPGNAGTVLRSADAAGADAVLFTSGSVDVYNPKAVRSSAGSLFHVPIVREADPENTFEMLRGRGLSIYAATADGEHDLFSMDLSGDVAFAFGNEAWGLPADVRDMTDATVRIPIAERAESLNLAAAATLCLFEVVRQRRRMGTSLAGAISSAAHDIRSPLTAVSGAASTLLKRWRAINDHQREEFLAAMGNDAARMNETLRELVDAARIVEGRLEVSAERLDLSDVVKGVAGKLGNDPDQPPIEIDVVPASALADPERITTAIRAMIRAATWWGREGAVRVAVRSSVRGPVVDVHRAGADIGSADAEYLFGAGLPGPGAGVRLGLFVARGVAQAHGGSLRADVSNGVRLTLSVPAP